ncbi:hypothetical protein BV22DRAFT_1131790 [Leucogyrophana mollusca]|uniref:Uncharacterized protein n=1 Tax=Leucogyrophana mollusca TaxID=85980 RepID=A0ACB8BAV3_9AGAM|nr:hypothetical protein BV22DRAFT_1131790 [Leucogyrophana mollusca]
MPILNADILHILIAELLSNDKASGPSSLLSISSTSRAFRESCLPHLFAEVHWPHKRKHDPQAGLHFFPESIWPHIRHFRLQWPDEWTEPNRLRWGEMDREGGYTPRNLEKFVLAISKMPKLTTLSLTCPFTPPQSIFEALSDCRSLTTLTFIDTPLDMGMSSLQPGILRRASLTPVTQALRIGDGPTEPKFAEVTYFMRDWRRRYRSQIIIRQARELRASASFLGLHSAYLTHLELSGVLCSLPVMAALHWPALHTFVLTGHMRTSHHTHEFGPVTQTHIQLFDVLDRMPVLRDLRLLFPETKTREFQLLGDVDAHPPEQRVLTKLASLTSFAVSNACKLDGIFNYMTSLERLAILAIIDLPRWPIALPHAEVGRIMGDIAASGCPLRHLRIIVEDNLTPAVCYFITTNCPKLEVLEIERCGYHDGKSVSTWQEFADAISPLSALQNLRICMQFPEYDDMDGLEPWRVVREDCARFFVKELKSLRRVGFEYRKRTGTHRYQDAWLDYSVVRGGGGSGSVPELHQLGSLWYPFPAVWQPVPLPF